MREWEGPLTRSLSLVLSPSLSLSLSHSLSLSLLSHTLLVDVHYVRCARDVEWTRPAFAVHSPLLLAQQPQFLENEGENEGEKEERRRREGGEKEE